MELSESANYAAAQINALGEMLGESHRQNPGHTKPKMKVKDKREANKRKKAARRRNRG